MKILLRALCAGLAISSLPAMASVTYQDIVSAATNPDDLSRQALVTIFGDVVTNPLSTSAPTLIGSMFGAFNSIIAVLAVVWFMFIGIRHVVRSGHQGQVFSTGRDIVGTLSVVAGFLMIVPTGNGWSIAQLIMLWGASIMGVGSANVMVQLAADNIANGYSMTVQPVQASTRTAARGIFEMELCKYAVNAGLNDFNQTAKSSTSLMTESAKTASGNYTVTVSNGSGICGSASLSVEGNGTTDQSTIGKFFNPFSKNEYSGVISAQRAAMDNMISDMDNAASEFVTTFLEKRNSGNGTLPDIETRIQKAADEYERAVQKSLPTDNGEQSRKEALKSYLTTYGWVTLGAWYQTFATANQRLAELADRAPAVTSMSSLGEVGDTDLFSAVMSAYRTQLQNSSYTPPLGTVVSSSEQRMANAQDPKSALSEIMGPLVSLTNRIATETSGTGTTSAQINPLIKMKNSSGCMNVSTNSEKEFYELLGINYDLDDLGYNDLMKLGASLKKNEFFKDVEVLLTGKRAELCNNISSAINKAFEIWQKQKVANEVGVVNAVTDDPVVTLEVEFYVNKINLPVHLSTIKKALNDANISLEKSIETKEVIVEKKVEVIPEGYMKINPKTSSIISQEEIAKRQNMIKEEISSRNKHIK